MTTQETPEEWRPVLGWEGYYEVSNRGRVRSLPRTVSIRLRNGSDGTYTVRGKILAQRRARYLNVGLTRNDNQIPHAVHVLVAEAFHGPRPSGMVACHSNDISHDNRAENIRWDTPRGNTADIKKNKGWRDCRGSENNLSKLTEIDVLELRRLRAAGTPLRVLASRFGVGIATVCQIANRKAWRHVA